MCDDNNKIRKHNSNYGKCGDAGWVCISLWLLTPIWCVGAGQETVKIFAQLASRPAPGQNLSSHIIHIWQTKQLPCEISQ